MQSKSSYIIPRILTNNVQLKLHILNNNSKAALQNCKVAVFDNFGSITALSVPAAAAHVGIKTCYTHVPYPLSWYTHKIGTS